MNITLPEEVLMQLSDFVAARMGLYFPRARWHDLERQLKLALKEFGYNDYESFLKWLLSSTLTQEQVEILASYLTISETYFWREPQTFAALREQVIPELINSRKNKGQHLRFWSAGCATGEEPYSMAIALSEALPNPKEWQITLLATDINPLILKKAAAGIYGEWSFRNAPPGFKEKYFNCIAKSKYEIRPEIRKLVTFAYLNLAVDVFPATMNDTNAMDLIFCRNVLMYFESSRARTIGQSLYQCLVEGGWLTVSSSELSQYLFPQFSTIQFPGAILYRREVEKKRRATISSSTLPIPILKKPIQKPLPVASSNALPVRSSQVKPVEMTSTSQGPIASIEVIKPEDATQMVRNLANQGKLDEAWAACEGAILSDKINPGLLYLGANILQELDRQTEAETLLKRALYLNPDFLMAYFTLGTLAQRKGNAAAAKKRFQNTHELLNHYDPDDILPEADGMTAGRLREIVNANLQMGVLISEK